MNLSSKTKRQHFSNIDIKNITDNRNFWKSMKSYFSTKGSISETLNNFFITKNKQKKIDLFTNASNPDINQITSAFNDQISITKF